MKQFIHQLHVETHGKGLYDFHSGYDALNRIASAGESGSNGRSEVFNADRYGNLWLSNITGNNFPTQSLMPTGLSSFSATTNHLVGINYDAAGNQTVLGGNTLAYDAEGRQISAQISGSAGDGDLRL